MDPDQLKAAVHQLFRVLSLMTPAPPSPPLGPRSPSQPAAALARTTHRPLARTPSAPSSSRPTSNAWPPTESTVRRPNPSSVYEIWGNFRGVLPSAPTPLTLYFTIMHLGPLLCLFTPTMVKWKFCFVALKDTFFCYCFYWLWSDFVIEGTCGHLYWVIEGTNEHLCWNRGL
jgi:hypothetical protein